MATKKAYLRANINLFNENVKILQQKKLGGWMNENKGLDHNLLTSAFTQEFLNIANEGLKQGVDQDQSVLFESNVNYLGKILFEDENPNNIVLELRISYENLVSPYLGDQIV